MRYEISPRGPFPHRGAEIFAQFAEHPKRHLITWEKDYHRDGWDQSRPADGEFIYERPRNNSKDLFTYHFSYLDGIGWPRRLRKNGRGVWMDWRSVGR